MIGVVGNVCSGWAPLHFGIKPTPSRGAASPAPTMIVAFCNGPLRYFMIPPFTGAECADLQVLCFVRQRIKR